MMLSHWSFILACLAYHAVSVYSDVATKLPKSADNHNLRRAKESFPNSPAAMNPYNYTCNREERISGRCRWCNRESPNKVGSWAPFPPYWQHPGRCANQAFDVEDTRKCMQGRTLYVIGNSVARQNAFNMVELLGGNRVKREDQRDQCPKHETTWDDSCHSEIAGVKIKYLFMQFIDGFYYHDRGGFPFFRYQQTTADGKTEWVTGRLIDPTASATAGETKYFADAKSAGADQGGNAQYWADDNCINHDTQSCLAKFFAGSTSRDLLMFTSGMSYEVRAVGEEPKHSPGVDHRAWLTASATAFRAHLGATFKGQVFRATMAEFNKNNYMAPITPQLGRANNLLDDIWRMGSEDLPWYTIDQWPINKNRHYLYDDHVHFNGPLTHALLHQVLNELCPGGGKDAWQYSRNMTQSMMQYNKTLVMSIAVSRFNIWYMVLHKGVRHNIPDMDTLDGLEIPNHLKYNINSEDLPLFPEGEPLVKCDKTWVPNTCKDSVYYKALHGLLV